MSAWLRLARVLSRWSRRPPTPARRPRPARPQQVVPRLEVLEERQLLTSVYFPTANPSVSEGVGNAEVEVLFGEALSQAVTVTYTLTPGTAAAADDYSGIGGTVTFEPGEVSKRIAVPINDDALAEGAEAFTVELVAADNAALGSTTSATVTIQESDGFGSASTGSTTVTSGSGSGSVGDFVWDDADADGVWDEDEPGMAGVTVKLHHASGTAQTTTGADGAYLFSGLPAGTYEVEFVPPPGGQVTAPAGGRTGPFALAAGQADLTRDAAVARLPVVTVTASDPDAAEAGPDPGAFTFTRSGGGTATALAIAYTVSGSAAADDYVLSGSAVIPAGQSSVTLGVLPLPDNRVEWGEDVVITLDLSSGYVIGDPDSASVLIGDDPPVVTVTASDPSASESGPDSGTFTFTRSGGDLSQPLAVSYLLTGSAQFGDDYGFSGSAVIPAGESSATLAVVPVTDQLGEGSETVILTLTASSGDHLIGSPSSDTVFISDIPVVTVTATDPAAAEATLDPGTFTFTRSGGDLSGTLSVGFTLGGSASGEDYTLLGVAVFAAGQTSVTVDVLPQRDNLVEPLEDVVVTLSPGGSVYLVGSPDTATVSIADDPPVVTVTASDPDAAEATLDPGAFTFSWVGGGNPNQALTVSYTLGGSATPGDDYDALQSVSIPSWGYSVPLSVTPHRDNWVEGDETVTVTLNGGTGAYLPGSPDSATVSIADDQPVVTVAPSDPSASEPGPGSGAFTFTRSGGDLSASLTVSYTLGGSASAADYTLVGTASFAAGASTATLDVVPLRDNLVEGEETVTLTLGASDSYLVGSPDTATVSIADDPPVVTVTASDPSAAEATLDPGAFTFTRSGGDLDQPLTVAFSLGGSATPGDDYDGLPQSVTIPAGWYSATLPVTPHRDNWVEGDETVTVTLNGGTGAYLPGSPGSATVSIADDPPVVTVTASDPSAAEATLDPGRVPSPSPAAAATWTNR